MSPLMSAEINKKDIEELLKTYSPNLMRKAIRSSLDRTGTWAKKYLANDVASNFNISASRVKKDIKVVRTTQGKLEASLVITNKQLSFINFGAYQDAQGVKVPFSKSKTYNYPHAFINVRGGNKFIAIRKTKKRYQVSGKPGRGPSIARLVDRTSERSKRNSDMTNHLYRELSDQIAKRTMGEMQTPELE
jgi:hypothetical protein